MQSTLQGCIALLVKGGILGGIALWGMSALPVVYAQTMSLGGFDFVVMGDFPYTTKDNDQDRHFERVIAAVNKLQPAFSIHVGDIKNWQYTV